MANVEARIKAKGKNFEILVDVDKAMQFRKGLSSIDNALAVSEVFFDLKKGLRPSSSDLTECFGTTDFKAIAEKIIRNGEILLPMEYRKKERDEKFRQVVTFLARNALDPVTGKPHSEKRIEEALDQSGVNVENKPIDQQISKILSELRKILPIKIETKRLRVTIPAIHTGKAYGLLNEYKEKEDWLANGDLSCVINLPAGLQMEFYDKLNGITHGSALVEEVK